MGFIRGDKNFFSNCPVISNRVNIKKQITVNGKKRSKVTKAVFPSLVNINSMSPSSAAHTIKLMKFKTIILE